jgi:hypothetical protein
MGAKACQARGEAPLDRNVTKLQIWPVEPCETGQDGPKNRYIRFLANRARTRLFGRVGCRQARLEKGDGASAAACASTAASLSAFFCSADFAQNVTR